MSITRQAQRDATGSFWLPLMVFILLTAGIVLGSLWFYASDRREIVQRKHDELEAIASFKIHDINAWRRERLADVHWLNQNPIAAELAQDFITHPDDARARTRFASFILPFLQHPEYRAIILASTNGQSWLLSGATNEPLSHIGWGLVIQSLAERRPILSDVHFAAGSRTDIHLDAVAPFFINDQPVGAVLFRLDPFKSLYPLVQAWPTPSPSAEALLLRRERDGVLFLNNPRHFGSSNAILRLHLPLDRAELVGVSGTLQRAGVVRGLDYRGRQVVAAVRPVPDTAWILVCKVDTEELLAPLRGRAWTIALFALLSISLAGLTVELYRRRRETRTLRQLQQTREYLLVSYRRMQELESIIKASPAVAFTVQPDTLWNLTYISDNVRQFGYVPDDFYSGRLVWELLIHPDDRARVAEAGRQGLAAGKGEFSVVYRLLNARGDTRWMDARIGVDRDETGRPTLRGVFLDITERHALQEQLLQAQKMETLGRLAGGVAHDFNNILQAIIGFDDLLLDALPPDDPNRTDAEEIQKAAERARVLVRQLLVFSRRETPDKQLLDLNEMVRSERDFLLRLIGEDVELQLDLAPGPCAVRADRTHLEQTLMNLAVNARDAMPEGGRITLATAQVTLDAREAAAFPDARPGAFARITMSDTGQGIAPAIIDRIFEPFFTTKPIGKGSGLGLAVVYGIVKEHDGWIGVQSRPGEGTRFDIYLPAVDNPVPPPAPAESPAKKPAGNGERILVLEDDDSIRRLAVQILRQNGYQVQTAACVREAREILEREQGAFDLCFSDVVLPDGNGVDLARFLQHAHPRIRILLASGYTDERARDRDIAQERFAFLHKPYASADLLRSLRQLLDRPAGPAA